MLLYSEERVCYGADDMPHTVEEETTNERTTRHVLSYDRPVAVSRARREREGRRPVYQSYQSTFVEHSISALLILISILCCCTTPCTRIVRRGAAEVRIADSRHSSSNSTQSHPCGIAGDTVVSVGGGLGIRIPVQFFLFLLLSSVAVKARAAREYSYANACFSTEKSAICGREC